MYVPGEQHPTRAVLDPVSLNAFKVPGKDSHWPPHKVRVKPLLRNTLKKKKRVLNGKIVQKYNQCTAAHKEEEKKRHPKMYVLLCMSVTLPTAHLERSPLKSPAP
jgi:hypothetical protein